MSRKEEEKSRKRETSARVQASVALSSGFYGHYYPSSTKKSLHLTLFIVSHSCGASGKVLGEKVNASLLRSPKSFGISSSLTLYYTDYSL